MMRRDQEEYIKNRETRPFTTCDTVAQRGAGGNPKLDHLRTQDNSRLKVASSVGEMMV